MSHRLFEKVKRTSPQKGSARMLLLLLADCQNDKTGICNPSVDTLAEWCNTSVRNVRMLIQQLVEGGELIVNKGGGRGNQSTFSVRTLDEVNSEEDFSEAEFTEETNSEDFGTETVNGSSVNSEKSCRAYKEEPNKPYKNHILSQNAVQASLIEIEPEGISEKPSKEKNQRQPDPIWDATVEVTGESVNKMTRGKINKWVSAYKESGYTAEGIRNVSKYLRSSDWFHGEFVPAKLITSKYAEAQVWASRQSPASAPIPPPELTPEQEEKNRRAAFEAFNAHRERMGQAPMTWEHYVKNFQR